jgi:hypothetical protein
MIVTENGVISNGGIALDNPLPLPEGSKVVVHVEVASTETTPKSSPPDVSAEIFAAFPFFGQWADRQDIPDSAEYVRQERAKWQQRPYRQD